jgi:serine/threonine-protein kinase
MSAGNVNVDSFGDQIEILCDRFEAEWQAGGHPKIQEYVVEAPEPARHELASELLKLDIHYRRERGDTILAGDYAEFPEHASLVKTLLGPSLLPNLPFDTMQAGRYRLEQFIARGGMGEVWEAHDPEFRRRLAIKILKEEYKDNPDMIARFLEEAHVTGQLQHPGVPPVHEIGRLADDRPFLAMKLIEGRTLADLLAERKPVGQVSNLPKEQEAGWKPAPQDLPRFLTIFEQICQTVAYAHSLRIIHRDLKPLNFMVGAFGEVQVMDWGLAKTLAPEDRKRTSSNEADRTTLSPLDLDTVVGPTRAGQVMGTWAYMPPEQARGEVNKVDQGSDVFSLGATLCEILTGEPAYRGPTRKEFEEQAKKADLADAFSRLDACGADAELIALAKKCLAAEMDLRPSDAGVVSDALAAYQSEVQDRLRKAEVERAAAEARAEGARAKARAERRARRLAVGLAAAVLLTVLAGGSAWLWVMQDRVSREQTANLALGDAEQLMDQANKMDLGTVEAAKQAVSLWRRAEDLLDQAESVLASGFGAAAARERLTERRRDVEAGLRQAEAVAKLEGGLDKARALRSNWRGGAFDYESADRTYVEAVADYGLDVFGPEPEAAAAAIRNERPAVRQALVVALDDWAECAHDMARARRLRQVADLADDDAWWRRYRAVMAGGDLDELKRLAGEARRQALPAVSQELLAVALMSRGARAEAITLLRAARVQHPADFWIYFSLGNCLNDPAHTDPATLDEALGCFWAAVALRLDSAPAHTNLGIALMNKGQVDEAIACYHKAIKIDPKLEKAHYNLGQALRGKGQVDEAIACYREAIRCWPDYALAHCELGRVLQQRGDFAGALTSLKRGHELGSKRRDWSHSSAEWVQQCERLLALDEKLSAILKGDAQPAGTVERLELASFCQLPCKRFHAAATRFFAEAFAAEPKLAEDPRQVHRYDAACSAALAAVGQAADAANLDDQQHTRLRKQALLWLRADLAAWTKLADDAKEHTGIRERLQWWPNDPDLASIRDSATVAKLPPEEKEACKKLWVNVADLLKKLEQELTYAHHQGQATCVAYSPGGKHAITGGFDRTLRLWSMEDGKEVRRFEGHTSNVWTVAFTRDGSRVISGSEDNTVRVWSVETGKELRRLGGHLATISSVGVLPDGKHALSGSWDKTVRLWDIETGKEVRQLWVAAPVLSVAIAADGNHALLGSNDGWLRYWDLWMRKEVKSFKGPAGMIEAVALTKEDRTAIVAGADAAIHIYSIATGNEEKTLEGHRAKIQCVVLSPDGLRILSSGEDKTLRLWDLESRRHIWIGSCADKVRQVAISPDGKRAVSACYDGSIAIWELPH